MKPATRLWRQEFYPDALPTQPERSWCCDPLKFFVSGVVLTLPISRRSER